MSKIEARLRELGITLPTGKAPGGNYVTACEWNGIVYVAGHGSADVETGEPVTGKVGVDLTVEQGYDAARLAGLWCLGTLQDHLGDLDRVERILKVTGFVNASPGFDEHPKVINGCSDLLVAIFGERGRHARSAVGMGSLPKDLAVEIEMIVAVRD